VVVTPSPSCFNVRRTVSDVASPILVVRTSNHVPGESAANGITFTLNSKIMCSAMHYWKRRIMRFSFCLATLLIFLPTIGSSQRANQDPAQSDAAAITVYKDFAVVRSTIDLDLKAGATDFTTTKVTRQLEPVPIDVAANGEQTIVYTVHYSW
jgi:hypothetical protein